MYWVILSAACIGIFLGLRLRVASVLAVSFLLAVINMASLPLLAGWSLLKVTVFLFALLSALQCGYLVGAIFIFSKRRSRSIDRVPAYSLGSRTGHALGASLLPQK